MHLGDPVTAPLLAGLAREYLQRYGASDEMATTTDAEFDAPGGGFLVMVEGDELLAGGGIRRHSHDTCEVKRMWTAPGHRRRGLAATVLGALEQLARDRGYTRVILETGPAQPEALALYTAAGYSRIPVYGRYPSALAFERRLST